MRRGWIAGVALVAAALGAPVRADVVVWNPNRFEERAGFEKLVAAYNATKGSAGPRVVVVPQAFDGFADKIAGAIPRGKGPDLFVYPQDRLGGWVDGGHIVQPIDALVDARVKERFLPVALPAMTYRGALYGLPLSFKVLALFYDRRKVTSPPRTTLELAALARKLTDRAAGVYGLAYLYNDYWYHAALQAGFGGRVFDPAMTPALDCPENVRAMELLVKWRQDFLPDEEPSRTGINRLFNEGRAAMVIEGPWFVGEVSKAIDYGIAALPLVSEANDQPMRPWMTVEGLYMSVQTRQVDAAWDFMRYATDLEGARIMATAGSQLPANHAVYADPVIAADPRLNAFFRQASVAIAMPNTADMTAMWTPATSALGVVLRGAATPQAALLKAQGAMVKGLAELRARAARDAARPVAAP